MIANYVLIALRHMLKNKLYAVVNLFGLAVGLMAYLFGSLLVEYEQNHDMFFEKSEQIYSITSEFSPKVNIGVRGSGGIYTGFRPFFKTDIPELVASARAVSAEFLLSSEDKHFYESIKFVDPEFLDIFNLRYIHGDASVLNQPTSLLITRSSAERYFGTTDVIGEQLSFDHKIVMQIGAVVEDLPQNTHFNSALIGGDRFQVLASLAALSKLEGYDLSGNWDNLDSSDTTYILLPEDKGHAWLQRQIDRVFETRYPKIDAEFVIKLNAAPIREANTFIYEAIGFPIMGSIQLLAILVLLVAIVNYTNLATAQSMGRIKEVGLRKTMGASQSQLILQFLVESLCVSAIAMLLAVSGLELMTHWFNQTLDKVLSISYITLAPWLLTTTLLVGIGAGLYPAYNIARTGPIEALRLTKNNPKSSLFRSFMLATQFSISIFMLAMVLVVYLQNKQIEASSEIYPKQRIVTLERLLPPEVQKRRPLLRTELLKIEGVDAVSYSSVLPFLQSNSTRTYSKVQGDSDAGLSLNKMSIDAHFVPLYGMPIVAGRNFAVGNINDELDPKRLSVNVLVNELAAKKLGFESAVMAVNQSIFDFSSTRATRVHQIVGVLKDQNYQGFHNQIKPTIFLQELDSLSRGSILMSGSDLAQTRTKVEAVWQQIIPEYPIQISFLQQVFHKFYKIFAALNFTLFGFAALAFLLSMVGLFGLSAFMAQNRTKEIGIRKVMGASVFQLVQLMIWQFSKPVLWSLLVALPLAYLGSESYLKFFANKLVWHIPIVIAAGCIALVTAWLIVAVHAWKIASANPISALRYE